MKRALLSIVLLLAVTGSVFADCALHDSPVVQTISLDITTLTVTAGTNVELVAIGHRCCYGSSGDVTLTATWDPDGTPQAMTSRVSLERFDGSTLYTYTEIFTLNNPTLGNKVLRFTSTGTGSAAYSGFTLDGVDQTTPTADPTTAMGTGTTLSVTVPSATGDCTIAAATQGCCYFTTTTQTQLYNTSVAALGFVASYALGGSSNTHEFTISSSRDWGIVGLHFLNSGAAATGQSRMTLTGAGK